MLHRLYPCGFNVYLVEYHHVLIAAAEYMGELSCLFGENDFATFVCVDKDIIYFSPTRRVNQGYRKLEFSGADYLMLSLHMPFLGFV